MCDLFNLNKWSHPTVCLHNLDERTWYQRGCWDAFSIFIEKRSYLVSHDWRFGARKLCQITRSIEFWVKFWRATFSPIGYNKLMFVLISDILLLSYISYFVFPVYLLRVCFPVYIQKITLSIMLIGNAWTGIWAYEHWKSSVKKEAKWWHRIPPSNSMDLCLDTDKISPSSLARIWCCI